MAGVTATGTDTYTSTRHATTDATNGRANGTHATPKIPDEVLPLTNGKRAVHWELQEEEYELTEQQLHARRDKIRQIYDKKKAQIDKEWDSERIGVRGHWWDDRRLNQLKRQLEGMTNELQERRAIEKEWRNEDGEESESDESDDEEEDDDESDDEEDDEEEWDPEAAKREIYKLETLKMRHEWEAMYYRMLIEKNDHTIRLSRIEQRRTEALLKVEEEYNREMYAWYKMRDEYNKRVVEEE
ncbi:hypothetical protein N0V85_009101 [Neurospora sp. IMI 360204]|nr:hypothetical protein N0V85_009101 [Neurospora sp. IMI 360204]